MIEELKILATKKDVPYQTLMKLFLSERITSELSMPSAHEIPASYGGKRR
jgi:hypothetical protein